MEKMYSELLRSIDNEIQNYKDQQQKLEHAVRSGHGQGAVEVVLHKLALILDTLLPVHDLIKLRYPHMDTMLQRLIDHKNAFNRSLLVDIIGKE